MFPALYPIRYIIAGALALAVVGGFYWRAYSAGETHAVQKQEKHDNAAKDAASRIRIRDLGTEPDSLLKSDPWLR